MLIENNVWLVIAAYNEGPVIYEVIDRTIKTFPNIVVVDDGSIDETSQSAINAGAWVVPHPINLGQGAALQTGIDFAILKGAQIVVTFDADGQHRVDDAISLISHLVKNNLDIVCGSRFLGLESETMPRLRRLMLKLAALFTRITTGIPVTDAHNGLRALSYKAAVSIRITQNRMAHASEIVSQIQANSLLYDEIPVKILYSSYSLAKGQKMSNSINILFDLFIGRVSK
jgi:glycosyltransferase involved in cell wall biosynthesis